MVSKRWPDGNDLVPDFLPWPALGMTVVAEGVETTEQETFLRDHACDEMQGYLFSKPLPSEQLAELLRSAPLMISPPLQPVASANPDNPIPRPRLKSVIR